MKKLAILPLCGILSACAEQPSNVEAAYVSSNAFRDRSCHQLMAERNDIVREVNDLTQQQKKAADSDAMLMGVGLVLFWPAVLAVGMTNDKSNALAGAKGNYNAITRQMTQMGCALPAETLTGQAVPHQTHASTQHAGTTSAPATTGRGTSGSYWDTY
ncbi:hypothetical protein [Marinibacterium sp. SX1]|uniref:hypothetical protein n=1 Tax=Marinibacterium sp. SX1 TaxID=3388424 RepID=UPI003D17A2B2